ncbi:hypothetical protein [Streptomyces sp. enrichment culture]|uniref:hypothetical protein n=1 Tax=Streptomyces sp. enrichment culture TaxID=1795815 RepID=UPI003F564879
MPIPEIAPIAHEPGYRTDTIGRYAEGQFFASAVYASPESYAHDDGWQERQRLHAVLHRFDIDGRRTDSDIWCAGTYAEQLRRPHGEDSVSARAQARPAELLDGLPRRAYRNIATRPFRPVVDGVLFGLVTERHEDDDGEDDWAEPHPDRLGFSAPWDGVYDA